MRLLLVIAAMFAIVFAVVPVSLAASEHPALDQLANAALGPVKFKMPDATLGSVFDTISKVGGFKVAASPEWPKGRVSVVWDAPTIREALVRLAKEFNLEYKTPSPHELVVSFKKK